MKCASNVNWPTVAISVCCSVIVTVAVNLSSIVDNVKLAQELIYSTEGWSGSYENFEGVVNQKELERQGYAFNTGIRIEMTAEKDGSIDGFAEKDGKTILFRGEISLGGRSAEATVFDFVAGETKDFCKGEIRRSRDGIEIAFPGACKVLSGKYLKLEHQAKRSERR